MPILRNNSFSLASDLLMKIPNGTETKVLSQVMPGTKWKWDVLVDHSLIDLPTLQGKKGRCVFGQGVFCGGGW